MEEWSRSEVNVEMMGRAVERRKRLEMRGEVRGRGASGLPGMQDEVFRIAAVHTNLTNNLQPDQPSICKQHLTLPNTLHP